MAARNALLKYLRVNVNTLSPLQNPRAGAGGLSQLISRNFSDEARGSFLDKPEVTDRVLTVVKTFQKIDPSKVTPNAHFQNDLGLDSLDTVEIVMALKKNFVSRFPTMKPIKSTRSILLSTSSRPIPRQNSGTWIRFSCLHSCQTMLG